MSFKTEINKIRRNIMHGLTKRIGRSYREPKHGEFSAKDIKNVLIIRPNHRLGNQLLLTPLVQEVSVLFPDVQIDIFVKGGVAFPVFQNYEAVKHIIPLPRKPFNNLITYFKCWFSIKQKPYDLVINADKNSSSGRLLTQLAKSKIKIFGEIHPSIEKNYTDHKHISKYPIYNLRYHLKKWGFDINRSEVPLLDIKLSPDEISKGKIILKNLVKNDNPTICIYTNATGNKCYSEAWWERFYSRLLKQYPEYTIIEMLPIENTSQINFKAPNFYSKDIREMAGIIKNTAVFIAADNGVMHLASAALNPTVGFFSVTDQDIYGPYGNGSFAINTNNSDLDDWIAKIDTILK
ncbi:glycosyltransferase family 9 protein [Gaetbulibacter aestuarii]|uniref:Glycosyltransferase family 9 protein n=1 Tax=Gaetbulibacter aestuarii TaxID=1502358 RepID=A0ABW7N0Q9_9FLAO